MSDLDSPETPTLVTVANESERKLRTLLQHLPGMVYRCASTPDWPMEYVSEGSLALTGYAPAELTGPERIAYGALIHPDDRAAVWAAIQSALQNRAPFTLTYRIRHRSDAERWAWERGSGVFAEDGALLAIEGFIIDVTEQTEARRSARTNARHLAALLDASPESMFLMHKDGTVLAANDIVANRLGTTRAALVGSNIYQLLPPDVAASRRHNIARALHTRQPVTFDDERFGRVIHNFIYPVIDDDGAAHSAAIYGIDVTDARAAEAALRYQASLIANVIDAVIATDLQFRIQGWNRAAEEVYGWSAAEAIGRSLQELVHPEYPYTTRAEVMRVFTEQGRWRGMTVHYHRDGRPLHILASVAYVQDEQGQRIGAVAVNRDISELLQAQDALRKNQAMLQAILDYAPALISMKDPLGNVMLVNRQFSVLAGPAPDEYIGRNVYDIFPFERADLLWQHDLAAIQADAPVVGEETVDYRDGSVHTYLTVKFPVKIDQELVGVCTISTDITDRKKAEDAISALHRMESLSRIAGAIAHEFSSLVTALTLQATIAREKLAVGSAAAIHLEKCLGIAERMASLTSQLRLYTGKGWRTLAPLDINEVIGASQKLLAEIVPDQVTVRYELTPALPPVLADSAQMQQILANLVANAAEAIGMRPGVITIATDMHTLTMPVQAHGQFAAGAAPAPGRYVRIMVRDTGEGITADSLTRIWEPFYTTRFTGRGLGLAVVLGIVRGLGGGLQVRSLIGEGADFVAWLPTVDNQ